MSGNFTVVTNRTAAREEVYDKLDEERDYQDALPPSRTDGTPHTVGNFLVMMETYMRRAFDAWTMNPGDQQALDNIRKIGGICVQAMEKHGAPRRRKAP